MFSWVLVGFGVILRFHQYLKNRALWTDEVLLAFNLRSLGFHDVLQPLAHNQAAPIGFLLLQKCTLKLFGNSEYALRLMPLIAGILSIVLIYELAKGILRPKAVPIAIALFSLSIPLVYYSSEVKQYSTDVMIALFLLLLACKTLHSKLDLRWLFFLGIAGTLSIYFSHPSIFVLGAVGSTFLLHTVRSNERNKIYNICILCGVWLISFFVNYWFFLSKNLKNDYLIEFWADVNAYMTFPPTSVQDIWGYFLKLFDIMEYPGGFALKGLAAFLMFIGVMVLNKEKKDECRLLLFPLLFVSIASVLRKYPFADRLILFLVPTILILISEGLLEVTERSKQISPWFGAILIVFFILHPYGFEVKKRENSRPAIEYIRNHWKEGDKAYIHNGAEAPFRYYYQPYGFHREDFIIGIYAPEEWVRYKQELNKMVGSHRVWVLFSLLFESRIQEVNMFLFFLGEMGTKCDEFHAEGFSVYLYDLSAPKPVLSERKTTTNNLPEIPLEKRRRDPFGIPVSFPFVNPEIYVFSKG